MMSSISGAAVAPGIPISLARLVGQLSGAIRGGPLSSVLSLPSLPDQEQGLEEQNLQRSQGRSIHTRRDRQSVCVRRNHPPALGLRSIRACLSAMGCTLPLFPRAAACEEN